MEMVLSPMDWAQIQFGGCFLGDARRTARLVKVGGSMVERSSASIPKQMEDWASIKGAYRLFWMRSVTHEAVSRPHWEATRERARQPGQGLVLFVQDQTELNFGRKPDSVGLGFVADTVGRGIEVQTTLGVIPELTGLGRPEVLGVALQTPWMRTHPPRKKIETGNERSKRRTEYDVWEESVAAIGPAPDESSGTTWVSVGDRASDVFTHLAQAEKLGWRCLVRSKHNRKLASAEQSHLHDEARALAPAGRTSISLRSRPGVQARTVELLVSYFAATLPGTKRSGEHTGLKTTCVRVWEDPHGSPAKEPIEWLLLTTLPVESLEDALEVIQLYRHRWLVEEYHKGLKTGCDMEGRNLRHADKLLPLLGVLGIVAVFLLQLKTPDETRESPGELVEIVRTITRATEDLSRPGALLRRIAMLGGFIGRKGDGEPGWQTIWAGWTRLQDILYGIQLAQAKRCGQ